MIPVPAATVTASPRAAVSTTSDDPSFYAAASTYNSTNWSGYEVGTGPYTSVTGTFTVPDLAVSTSRTVTAEWVGIDDGTNNTGDLIQAGVIEGFDPTLGRVVTGAWWEILPAPNTIITTLPIVPGDSVTVSIAQLAGTLWAITVADNTIGQSYTTDQTYSGPQSSAEWIVEAPTSLSMTQETLGAYSPPVVFSNLRMGGTETTLEAITMVQGGVAVSTPSALTSAGFTVSYTGSTPGAPPPTPTPTPTLLTYTITAGQGFQLLISGGPPYTQVQWQSSPDGRSWSAFTTVTLDASGASTYTFTPTATAYYRTYEPVSGLYGNNVLEVVVVPGTSAAPSPSASPISTPSPSSVRTIFTVTAGEPVTLTQAAPANVTFTIESSPDDVTWTALAQVTSDASGEGSYTFTPSATAYYRSLFADGPSPAGLGVVLPAVSPTLVLGSTPVITWGGATVLTVGVGVGPARQVDILASRDDVTWSRITTVTTSASGTATFAYRPPTNLLYRAVFAGAPDLAAASSARVRTVVRQLALPKPNTGGRTVTVTRGTSVSFSTTLRPDRVELPAPVATFRVFRWTGSRWALYRTVVVTANSAGVATLRWTFAVGSWYITSMANPTPYNANSIWSAPLRYIVR